MFNLTKVHNLSCSNNGKIVRALRKNGLRSLSTKVAIKQDPPEHDLIKDFERIAKISSKEIKKKPQKPPFAKNLFLGTYDTDILTYPEVLEKADADNLPHILQPINEFFQSRQEDGQRKIAAQYLENLSKLRLIGLRASTLIGGRQLSITETCRFNEAIAQNTSRISIMDNEQFGIQLLLKKANDTQKQKYLENLINGKSVSALCIAETKSFDTKFLKMKATMSDDRKSWILNGEKTWVVNGDTAHLFVVLAESTWLNDKGLTETKNTVFLVERSFGGVSSKTCKPIGLDETDIANVVFENTRVPVENVLGDIGEAENVLSSIVAESRLNTGPACSTLLRILIDKFVKHCVDTDMANISETEAVQSKIGEMITSLYAIESMTYLTSALLDQYENQDCELEAAIVKLFSAEQCYKSTIDIMNFIGTSAYMLDNWCNKLSRDALGHLVLYESSDNLKMIIGLLGLQHAGIALNDSIKVNRNPLFNPAATFKRMFDQQRHIDDRPKLTLKLHEYLHPSATNASKFLEYTVLRLQFATECLLTRYGPDVISKHTELRRLAECVIDIYAMTAVIGRASRSYCIGLQYADFEMNIANAFCRNAMERVKTNVRKIWDGPYNTSDENYIKLAKQIFKSGQYFPVHPLTRNF